MGVTYLVPTLERSSLWNVVRDFRKFADEGDELRISTEKGMTHALREAFQYSTTDIVRNCADDDTYPPEANRKAVAIMEKSDIDVLVTGGTKARPDGTSVEICVPKGANYGHSLESVAQYGACGSGLFMRREAVTKHALLNYDGHLIDNYIVLAAIQAGLKVRFLRLNTYTHRMSVHDTEEGYGEFRAEKKALRNRFGIGGIASLPYETPANWDGESA